MTEEFAARRGTDAAFLGAGVATALLAVALDTAGRLLLGIAAAMLLGEGLRLLLMRPILLVSPAGLTLRPGLRRIAVPWPEVDSVAACRTRRLVALTTLEIEVSGPPERLIVLPAYLLGTSPAAAAEAIEAARPASW
jgi:hypothetical protein